MALNLVTHKNKMLVIILGHKKEDVIRQNKNLNKRHCKLCRVFYVIPFFYHEATDPGGLSPPHYPGFTTTHTHTLTHTTLGRTPLDE